MNSAGRADKHNLLRALTLYGLILTIISLILIITYKYYTAELDILRLLVVSSFTTIVLLLIARSLRSGLVLEYAVITSLYGFSIIFMSYEYLVLRSRDVDVTIIPLLNIIRHEGRYALSIDLGQLVLVIALVLTAIKLRGKGRS